MEILTLSISIDLLVFLLLNKYSMSELTYQNLLLLAIWVFIGAMIIVFLYTFIEAFIRMKKGIHNIRTSDDELFENIDRYKECWNEDNNYYIR